MSMVIRNLEAHDREPLKEVLESDSTFRPDEIAVALELIDDALANQKSDYWIRIASAGSDIAGYICFGPTPMTERTYDLYWIVTHSAHRGKGVARSLVSAMEREIVELGGGNIRVETSETEGYGAARKLYARLDYPEVARFENFYSGGDALIVFYKQL